MRKMKDIEVTERIVKKRECVEFVCDLCGQKSIYPSSQRFDLCGGAGSGVGKIKCDYSIDGEYEEEEINVCYACASILIGVIKNPVHCQGLIDFLRPLGDRFYYGWEPEGPKWKKGKKKNG